MIFVCVGTTHMRFDRLVQAIEQLPLDEVVIQHGPVDPPAGVAYAAPFMSFDEMMENFARATAVVTHAGVGNVLCAFNAGHTPVVVPRLKRFHETVDDHQTEFVRALESRGRVIGVWDTADLVEAVDRIPPRRTPPVHEPGELHMAVTEALDPRLAMR